ncbi:MAG TPA: hypothetical protein VG013_33955 [Gemmataceae bacterium]|nr:hypothetical protein [Gemmataceae bacterium]
MQSHLRLANFTSAGRFGCAQRTVEQKLQRIRGLSTTENPS